MTESQDNKVALQALEELRTRLLDLTLHNKLINFRHTKRSQKRPQSLRIVDELPDQLAETLLDGKEMRFRAVPRPKRNELIEHGYIEINQETGTEEHKPIPTAEKWAELLRFPIAYEVPEPSKDERNKKRPNVPFYPDELELRLKGLLQRSELLRQEKGMNILYLSFGFLEWFVSDPKTTQHTEKAQLAPLFLIPVELNKGNLNSNTNTYEYSLKYSREDILPNLSLREKLRVDFGMSLPELNENTTSELNENTTPEIYFNEIKKMIKEKENWCVRRYISIALLEFSKILMYRDLDPAIKQENGMSIMHNPLVVKFLNASKSEGYLEIRDEHSIDKMEDIHEKYPLIDDADSSQHSALIDAINGNNLVIVGPPGTGKSQTITNLIAAAMARGKKVLFVAEKEVALEVVRERLNSAGLGEFCFNLHSHKSQKKKIIDAIEYRLKQRTKHHRPSDIDATIAAYEERQMKLNSHVEKINQNWKDTAWTLHQILMTATRYREAINRDPKELRPSNHNSNTFTEAMCQRAKDRIDVYKKVHHAVAVQIEGDTDLHKHPWYGVCNTELQMFDIERVKISLSTWQSTLQDILGLQIHIKTENECKPNAIPSSLNEIPTLLTELECLPSLHGDELLDRLPVLRGDRLQQATQYLALFENIQSLYASLEKEVGLETLQDLSVADEYLVGCNQLCQIVDQPVRLKSLSDAIKRLKAMPERLSELEEPLNEVRKIVDKRATKYLLSTEYGLTEFKIFIDLINDLSQSHLKLRDDIFDNDDIDELLPKLRADIYNLITLRNALQNIFRIDILTGPNELRKLQESLVTGGAFCWFKSSWRATRKQVLSYAAGSRVKFSMMRTLLDTAIEFSERLTKLNENKGYQKAFGRHLNGLDTDVDTLESLRNWYKKVRKQYGVRFGPKVSLGDALFKLPVDVARALRALVGQEGKSQVSCVLDDLTIIKNIFAPVSELQNKKTLLVGKDSPLTRLPKELDETLQACGPLVSDLTISITQLVNRAESLVSLKELIKNWKLKDIDNQLFEGRLVLKPMITTSNESSLVMFRNTLAIATYVEKELKNKLLKLYIYTNPTESTFQSLSKFLRQLKEAMNNQASKQDDFSQIVKLNIKYWMRQSGDNLDALIARNSRAFDNEEALHNWLGYIQAREQINEIGLSRLVDLVEQGDIGIQQMEDAYQAGVFGALARDMLGENPELMVFAGRSQEAIQKQFREYDNKLKELQRKKIAWKLDQNHVPRGNSLGTVAQLTELAFIQHQVSLKIRHKSIRELVRKAGRALVALKPCFMMSPMSVAQYLDPSQIKFDMVVMDEASQIEPQDALGAIARGTKLVVVGDPKQLPPTMFFKKHFDATDNDADGIVGSESILDFASSMLWTRQLRWHYRSQHESLIAFSNHTFYNGDLILFPSPNSKSKMYGIKDNRVKDGCFIDGKNEEEANSIVKAVQKHFLNFPNDSLGIVTMNYRQCRLIDNKIEMLTKTNDIFRVLKEKDSRRSDPMFVKNLETVQGDERDVIFISMTYGPRFKDGEPETNHGDSETDDGNEVSSHGESETESEKKDAESDIGDAESDEEDTESDEEDTENYGIHQRFGAINSRGGERRLNVLFTRAKKRMRIFRSMGSDNVNPDAGLGVKALHEFLKYCATGELSGSAVNTGDPPGSDFEVAVITALKNEGFMCVPQVGDSGYFIDVGVRDPGKPGRYLMGIECDGATYHSAKSARDRDRLRQNILERQGWIIRRIWSTDWFKNPVGELKPIIRELNSLKTKPATKDQPENASAKVAPTIKETEKQSDTTESSDRGKQTE